MKLLIGFLTFLLLPFTFLLGNGDSINQDWYSAALDNIKKQEYHITYSEESGFYQSPNRNNNLRFTYKNNGFIVTPRITETFKTYANDPLSRKEKIKVSDDWKAEFTVLGYGRNGNIENKFEGREFIVDQNTAFIDDKNMKVDYINNEEGMRQNFTIYNKPKNDKGFLTFTFQVKTKERLLVGADALVIKNEDKTEYMKYNSLKIWDADGKELRGWFENVKNYVNEETKQIQIVVNDLNAIYPIVIDPLSTTEDWSVVSAQVDSKFGFSVATAGDVNGDGFSDIIIGAPYFEMGGVDGGAVFFYYGSATGLPANMNVLIPGGTAGIQFGYSVSTAGDVNGDGFSDVIIGSPYRTYNYSNEGAAYVYHGSPGGLESFPSITFEGGQADAHLGTCVSTAGDFDGNGYSDVVVSAPNYTQGQSEEGRVYVFYSSDVGSGLTQNNWNAEGNQVNAHFGLSVSTAGDYNGDGFSDIIIGAPDFNVLTFDDAGLFLIYFGSSSGITSYIFKFGSESSGNFGKSVSTAGDVNGDGYSDVIIGRNSTIDAVYRGVTEVYHGYDFDSENISSLELVQAPDWSADLISSIIVDGFGDAVSTAGDVNGDGFADVVIGAKSFFVDGNFVGGAFLYYGSSNGLESNYSWMVEGTQNNGLYGNSVGIAGDVNGDGYSDIIIGESGFNGAGKAFVYFGSYEGMIDDYPEILIGTQIGSETGISVSTAGDVDGDGFSDIIVGAPNYDGGLQDEGAAFVYYGANDGIDQNSVLILEGNQADAKFGSSVSTAGDVNGDGYDDVIVGAPRKTIGSDIVGAIYLFEGSNSGLSASPNLIIYGDNINPNSNPDFGNAISTAGDVNGDGFADIIIGNQYYGPSGKGAVYGYYGSSSGLSNTASWVLIGNSNEGIGTSVSTAGDVNGDGYSDIIIGSNNYSNGQVSEGAVYVFHGSASGLSKNADWFIESDLDYASIGLDVSSAGDVNGDGYSDVVFSAYNSTLKEGAIYLYHGSYSGLSTNANWSIVGNQNFSYFGSSLSTAGDVNGDGYSDLLVGAYGYDDLGSGVDYDGKVYLYKGSKAGLSNSEVWSHTGGNEFQFGISVSTAGDINGDGYSDIIVGAPGFNGQTIIVGEVCVFYGNSLSSLDSRLRQNNSATGNILAAGNLTKSNGEVEIGLKTKSPFGRADGRMVYEFRKNGEPFSSGDSITNSVSYEGNTIFEDLLLNPTGKGIFATVSGLQSTYSDAYQWRARKEFSLVNNPYQRYGPWKYYSAFSPIQPYAFRPRVFIPLNIIAQIKVLLEGPYDEIENMTNTLITSIPNESPYNEAPATATNIPSNAVDWVMVELRDKNDNTKILGRKSAFLLQDKTIRELDGQNPLSFALPDDEYYIVVKHRNHLPIMSKDPVHLTAN
ncbi:MAG: FG-GAP repeat protein [Ignavibacteriales bacterium]|nr:FG-GAP repeat protein [Ignavibacteriales bacterium]